MGKELISIEEVKKHNQRGNVWIVIRNEVYNVTPFISQHPGGEDPLYEAGGMDATIAFDDVGHSADAKKMLKKYHIGTLAPGSNLTKLRPQIWRPSSPYHFNCVECNASRRGGVCRPPPSGRPWWQYALAVLTIALIAGVAYKKFAS